jgi:hypothetical protein
VTLIKGGILLSNSLVALYEPCRNGATCNETNVGKGYECLCDKFYGGPQCHTGNFWTVNIGYIWHDSPAF